MISKDDKLLSTLQALCARKEYCSADIYKKALKGLDEDENGLYCSIEDLTEETSRAEDGLDMLSPYLVPYATNKRVDEISESIHSYLLFR